jgi:serine phosphatase RsbU (regulator of sigma subunit)
VPRRLRALEPLACLALAGHAAAVQAVASHEWVPLIMAAAGTLVAMGLVGLAGWRSTAAVVTRGTAILMLGFMLQAVRADTSGYFLLWFFVLVAVYPLVLPARTGRLVALVVPVGYLALLPLHAVDGPVGIALLRSVSLALIGVFVHAAAAAYRSVAAAYQDSARQVAQSEATAQAALGTLQRALLPPEVTSQQGVLVAARYRAAGVYDRIGGDWYDTIGLSCGGLALVIGDVEGHDLVAASVMGRVRGAVRSYALEGHPPSVVLQLVNAFLLSEGVDRLVTMAYVQLYPDDTIVTVASAGHPAPVVVPSDGAPVWSLDGAGGPILGLDGPLRWQERTVQIPPDAALVLYTDGLLAGSADIDAVPDVIAVAAEYLASGSVDQLADTLIGGTAGRDDAAVLVARVTSTSAPPARRTFPAQPISAGISRTWLTDLVEVWQASGDLPDGREASSWVETAQLLLTELVSNAVRHSDQSLTVQVTLRSGRLRVQVADSSDRMPVMRRPEAAATEGRGLRLVDTMSSAWGVELIERGKTVWFELTIDGPGGDDPGGDDVDVEALLEAFAGPDSF